MGEKSSFFNSISKDRTYKAEDWAEYFATFVSNGVALQGNGTLAVTAAGGSMSVLLGSGSAFINGYRYANTAALPLDIPTAHASLNRIDAVMIRWNRTLRAINAYVVAGTPAATPTAEAPARTADIHELCVAHLYVAAGATSIAQGAITDTRLDSSVCGVATMIGELDTSTLYTQIQGALAGFQTDEEAAFTAWSGATKAAMNAWTATEQVAFAAWFATVQSTLGSDVAGNLLNLINRYKARNAMVTLTAADWVAGDGVYTQTKSVSIVPASCALHASPAWASREAYNDAECGVSAASAGSVTFTATAVPTGALTVNLSVSEVDA